MSTAAPRLESLVLQKRDIYLLRDLFESRIMTAAHVTAIHFDGKKEAAKKRLQKLKAAGCLTERARRVNEPAVLFLSRKGLKLLQAQGILTDYPPISLPALEKRTLVSDLTIRHELMVMDVKAAWHEALRGSERFSIAEFGTWPLLYQFEAFRSGYHGAEVVVRPDGFVRIHEREPDGGVSEHSFFLEVDRSTETQGTLVSRAGCYLDHYKSGGFAVRNGAPRSAFKEYPFRVLMVLQNAERRNNTAQSLLQHNPPILTHVSLTTLDEVKSDPLGSIWIRPLDYREAVKGTQFDSPEKRRGWGYRRQTERDLVVERRAKRFHLLDSD